VKKVIQPGKNTTLVLLLPASESGVLCNGSSGLTMSDDLMVAVKAQADRTDDAKP
jgi:hypothetical protein